MLDFLGGMVLAMGGIIRRPRTANFRDIPSLMNRSGADAVPIVVLLGATAFKTSTPPQDRNADTTPAESSSLPGTSVRPLRTGSLTVRAETIPGAIISTGTRNMRQPMQRDCGGKDEITPNSVVSRHNINTLAHALGGKERAALGL